MRVAQAVKPDVGEVGQDQAQRGCVADVFEGFADVFQHNAHGKNAQKKPQAGFDGGRGEMPGSKIYRHNVDADEDVVETEVANPNRVVGQKRRRYEQNRRDQAVNDAQYRSTNSDVIRFAA